MFCCSVIEKPDNFTNNVFSFVLVSFFRFQISMNEFVPETHKLMCETEKLKFVNEVYKGKVNSFEPQVSGQVARRSCRPKPASCRRNFRSSFLVWRITIRKN